MKRVFQRKKLLAATIAGLLLAGSQLGAADSIQDLVKKEDFSFETFGTQLELLAPFDFESAELRVRQRGTTEVWTRAFGPGDTISTNLMEFVDGELDDSRYTYEIQFILAGAAPGDSEEFSTDSQRAAPITYQTSGRFNVVNGEIGTISIPGDRSAVTDLPDGSLAFSSQGEGDFGPENVTDPGNLAIGGYGVFGSSNTTNVIPGKLRILPAGTGSGAYSSLTSQSFAENSDVYAWHFGSQGGDFGLQRQRTTAGSKITVMGIEEDAPENSLMITDTGQIGMGTATPAARLHLVGPDNAVSFRMQSTGSIHELRSGEFTGFSINQISPNRVPFSIQPAAPNNSLRITANGNVGLGTSAPSAALHVRRTNGTSRILLEETQSIATNTMLTMRHNGNPGFELNNTGSGATWQFRLGGSGATEQFTVNKVGTGVPEASFSANGNLRIAGSLIEGSSRELKQDIKAINPEEVLARLSDLMLAEWSYARSPSNRHFGPMAEDFHGLFGLGVGPDSLSPRDLAGVAVAAAQALNTRNEELTRTTRALVAHNQELIQRIEQIEQAMAGNTVQ